MNKYRLNGLDDNWIFEAASEDEATKHLIEVVMQRAGTYEEYCDYCNDVHIDPILEWEEV